jgi:parvulin-like peptidyl-prolyl isomerase
MRAAALLGLAAVVACDPADEELVVARAAGDQLFVDDVVSLLVGETYPNEVQVPYTVAELWVDYTLLARAVAEDANLAQLDMSQIVEQQAEQDLILGLREVAVQVDTVVTDDEIQRRFSEFSPGARVHARHIFLAAPEGATPLQRDSVRALAASLRDRVVRGENFEELARQYSQDAGTAAQGGDLGWMNRNELSAPLDSIVFSMQPGEVSDVVESLFGLHVLRVEEKETPPLDDVRPQVRAAIQQQRVQAAESVLISSVEEGADLQVQDGAVELARRAAETPGMQLSRRAANRELVTFRGGALTMSDVATFMQSRASQFRIEIFNAPDQTVEQNLLLALAQRKLLAAEAAERGLQVTDSRRDSLAMELRTRLSAAASDLGLTDLPAGSDPVAVSARERHIQDLLREMLRGTRDVTPLGSFSFILRDEYGGQVNLAALQLVLQRIQERRSGGAAPTAPPGATPPPAVLPPMNDPAGTPPPTVAPQAPGAAAPPPPGGGR